MTTVLAGELARQKSGGAVAVPDALQVGDGAGGANADVVRLYASGNQIADTAQVAIFSSGWLDLNGISETIGSLAGGGTIALASGTLTVGANNTSTSSVAIISGTGGITKVGTGTLTLGGAQSNAYTGPTWVQAGQLTLAKAAGQVAVARPLTIGDGLGGANADVVALAQPNNIADGVAANINSSGLLNLQGFSDTIGLLAGSGNVTLGAGTLTVGGSSTTPFSGAIGGTGGLDKSGAGALTLTGISNYTGTTAVTGGTLLVTGSTAASPVTLTGGTLGGTGAVGSVTASGGALSPGASTAILSTANLHLGAPAAFAVELNGTSAGSGYDQLNVAGSVNLTGSTLTVTLGFVPAMGNAFRIIQNDGGDSVTGTLAGLPEGASLAAGGQAFQISYTGGTGNDVVLTALGPICTPRPKVGVTVTPMGPGVLQATITTPSNATTPGNGIAQLQFAAPTNGSVDVQGGPQGQSGAFSYAPPGKPASLTLTVHRTNAGPVHVNFTVTDLCPAWPTFVGAGANVP